jgi:hypothetical protein
MSDKMRGILWRLLAPVLVAMIVAFLTALGVSVEVARQQQLVSVAGTTHFTNLYAADIEASDDLTVGDDAGVGGDLTVVGSASYTSASVVVPFVDTSGSFRVTDAALITGTLAVQGPVSDMGTTFMVDDNTLITGTLGVSGATTVGGTLGVTGVSTFATFGTFTKATAISVTTNGYITPTGTYQPLESFGNVYTGNLAVQAAGRILVLVNSSNTTITITDTSTTMLSATVALGQYDALTLMSDGTNWIQLAVANN